VGLGQSQANSPDAAVSMFKKACELGDGADCYQWGEAQERGNSPEVATAYKDACRLHFPAPGCNKTKY
jgi:hypothetical protein